jgi:hypothetical protein
MLKLAQRRPVEVAEQDQGRPVTVDLGRCGERVR